MFLEREGEQVVPGQLDLVVDRAVDAELPVGGVHRRHAQRSVDPVEVARRRDVRRDAGYVEGRSRRDRGRRGGRGGQPDRPPCRGGGLRGGGPQSCGATDNDRDGRRRDAPDEERAPFGGRGPRGRRRHGCGGLPPTEPGGEESEHDDGCRDAEDRGGTVQRAAAGTGGDGQEREDTADGEHDGAERRARTLEHARTCADRRDDHGHQDEQGDLVAGAEQRHHEVLRPGGARSMTADPTATSGLPAPLSTRAPSSAAAKNASAATMPIAAASSRGRGTAAGAGARSMVTSRA